MSLFRMFPTALAYLMASTLAAASFPSIGQTNTSVRLYDEFALSGHGIGTLRLSDTHASFSTWRGRLAIQFAGVLPNESDSKFAGSKIYRVTNSDDFFKLNRGYNSVCRRPIKWMGIEKTEFPNKPEEIWVTLFEIDDYNKFRAYKSGLCGAFAYRLHTFVR